MQSKLYCFLLHALEVVLVWRALRLLDIRVIRLLLLLLLSREP
jgi:hypothetical protein